MQCAIPVFEGLLDEPHNARLMKLLYRTAEWHALAKLRLHTDSTLTHFDSLTTEFGRLMREFRDHTCSEFNTVELQREVEARARRAAQVADQSTSATTAAPAGAQQRKPKTLNLNTPKYHFLGDYVAMIKLFGTTDSYSTQTVCELIATAHLNRSDSKLSFPG